jgi:hypothetical protein
MNLDLETLANAIRTGREGWVAGQRKVVGLVADAIARNVAKQIRDSGADSADVYRFLENCGVNILQR